MHSLFSVYPFVSCPYPFTCPWSAAAVDSNYKYLQYFWSTLFHRLFRSITWDLPTNLHTKSTSIYECNEIMKKIQVIVYFAIEIWFVGNCLFSHFFSDMWYDLKITFFFLIHLPSPTPPPLQSIGQRNQDQLFEFNISDNSAVYLIHLHVHVRGKIRNLILMKNRWMEMIIK